jgi:hypothetical protein
MSAATSPARNRHEVNSCSMWSLNLHQGSLPLEWCPKKRASKPLCAMTPPRMPLSLCVCVCVGGGGGVD